MSHDRWYNAAANRFEDAPAWYRLGGWMILTPIWRLQGWMRHWDYLFRMRYRDRWLKPSRPRADARAQ